MLPLVTVLTIVLPVTVDVLVQVPPWLTQLVSVSVKVVLVITLSLIVLRINVLLVPRLCLTVLVARMKLNVMSVVMVMY